MKDEEPQMGRQDGQRGGAGGQLHPLSFMSKPLASLDTTLEAKAARVTRERGSVPAGVGHICNLSRKSNTPYPRVAAPALLARRIEGGCYPKGRPL